jgi:TusA-related sulfurtransferase
MQTDKAIDCKGLSCPEPILHTKMAINQLTSGQILEVQATDPGSINDMAAWSRRTGNEIVEQAEEGGVFTFYIKKS